MKFSDEERKAVAAFVRITSEIYKAAIDETGSTKMAKDITYLYIKAILKPDNPIFMA